MLPRTRFERRLVPIAIAGVVAAGLVLARGLPDRDVKETIAPEPPTPLERVLAKVQERYAEIHTLRARFKGRYRSRAEDRYTSTLGDFAFTKPCTAAWHYSDPDGDRVVHEEHRSLSYRAATNEYAVVPDATSPSFWDAVSFMCDDVAFATLYSFALVDAEEAHFVGGAVLVATPRTPGPVVRVLYYVDLSAWLVRRSLVLTTNGDYSRFDFEDVRVNGRLDAATFSTSMPEGARYVDFSQGQ